MFTDTEVALSLRYNAEVAQVTRQAQSIVNRQDREIARLRRQLSVVVADSAELRREKGQRAIDHLLSIRAMKKRRSH